jgi:hypothetical protein
MYDMRKSYGVDERSETGVGDTSSGSKCGSREFLAVEENTVKGYFPAPSTQSEAHLPTQNRTLLTTGMSDVERQ